LEFERGFVVLANWKMHKTLSQSVDYVKALKEGCQNLVNAVEIILCIPFTALAAVSEEVGVSMISVGAQDVHERDWGAYTGEVSAPMLVDTGCQYCMIGHSERRKYFSETDEMVNRKARALLREEIVPIVCIGETPEERKKGLSLNKLEKQIAICFDGFSTQEMTKTVVLYEPIWAIGTGKIATPEQTEEAHQFIRLVVEKLFSKETAHMIRIVYGGSVKWSNVSTILRGKDINGVAMGSESLDVQNFLKIVQSCTRAIINRKDFNTAASVGEK